MNLEASIQLSQEDIEKLEDYAAQEISERYRIWLYNQSRSPKHFYQGLSNTIDHDENNVIGSGLTEYITERRYLTDAFVAEAVTPNPIT